MLMRNPQNIKNGKNVGPIKHIVASIFGVQTARKDPKPTAVFVAIKMNIVILM